MAIDFTLPADVLAVRDRVRGFMENEVAPAEDAHADGGRLAEGLRRAARAGAARRASGRRTCRPSSAAWGSGRSRWRSCRPSAAAR